MILFFTIGRYAAKNQFTGRRLDTKKKPITTFGDHLTNRYKEITGGRVKCALTCFFNRDHIGDQTITAGITGYLLLIQSIKL
jgi:hypothetical protein